MTDHADGIPRRNGLRVDAAKQREWQRRGAAKYAAKQRQRRFQAGMTTKATTSSRSRDWSDRVRRLAKGRSHGYCEVGGSCRATHLHHRKLRRFGDHRIQNALHVCGWHHDFIHGKNGGSIDRSKLSGWIVAGHANPANVTVLIASGDRVLLDEHGRYRDAA